MPDERPADEPAGEQTIGALIGRCLLAVGATRVFGSSSSGLVGIPGLKHLRVDEPALAALLGDAQGRVTGGRHPGASLQPGRRLRVGAQPGLALEAVPVSDPALLPELIAGVGLGPGLNGVELILDLDLAAPAPAGIEPVTFGPSGRLMTLDPSLRDLRLMVLAGPGVVRAGAVEALRSFAAQAGVAVATTIGAVGALRSDDPHWAGTVGLQEHDFALAGLADARIVIAVGVDPVEAPAERWASGRQVLEVEPQQLAPLAFNWPPLDAPPSPSALVTTLDDLLAPLVADRSVPLTPALAARDLAAARPRDGVITADVGPAGLWLARACRVDEPGTLVLPAFAVHGFAVAAAIAAALDQRPAMAVTTSPLDPATDALIELAGVVGSQFTLVEWGADVVWSEATAHRVALRTALDTPGLTHVPVPVDFAPTSALFEALGPVIGWPPGAAGPVRGEP